LPWRKFDEKQSTYYFFELVVSFLHGSQAPLWLNMWLRQ
jgi:hypothetical protein